VKNDDNGDTACDSYRRYSEDIALKKQIGLQAYRFSINWPRVMPEGVGPANQAGLDHYDRLIDALLEAGIEPWVTLYHWDLPSALQEKGGWLSRATVDAFREFAAVIGKRFSGRVKYYTTINEPQCVALLGHGTGEHAPGLRVLDEELAVCIHHLALAHGAGARALRESSSVPVQVGAAVCGRLCYPETDSPAGRDAAYAASFRLQDDDWLFTFNIYMDPLMFHRYPDDAPRFVKEFEAKVSRGVGAVRARQLLTYAFAADVLEQIELEPLRTSLEELTLARFTRDDR
jgi:beta-glucosidase